jgi:peptidyl-prolyl cis-trans isomerase B (cyclophilin B)
MRRSVLLIALACGPLPAIAQLSPRQLYNGVNRPLLINVATPKKAAKLDIRLLTPVTGKVIAMADVAAGPVDIADKLKLWVKQIKTITYAQLYADGKPFAAPLVLDPMVNPTVSKLGTDGKTVVFEPDEDQAYAGLRVYTDSYLQVDTSAGKMVFALRPDCAPNTAINVLDFARQGLYTNTIFHRVVYKRKDGTRFVIQGGDPAGTGSGGPGWAYALENSPLPHDFGVISIARSTDPNTNGCQIFVALSREGTKHLDGKYASFGQLIQGVDVVREIATVKVGKDDRPLDPPVIRQIRLIPADPYPLRPKPTPAPQWPDDSQ